MTLRRSPCALSKLRAHTGASRRRFRMRCTCRRTSSLVSARGKTRSPGTSARRRQLSQIRLRVRCRFTTCMRSTISRTRICSAGRTTRPRRSARLCRACNRRCRRRWRRHMHSRPFRRASRLERQNWAEAAALEPRSPKSFPWASYPAVEAITHFARALGAARSGRGESARQSLATLAELRDRAAATNAYWGTQVEIQRLSAAAWLQLGRRAAYRSVGYDAPGR